MKKLPIKILIISLFAVLVSACGSSAYEYRTERMVIDIDVPLGKTVAAVPTGLSVVFDSIEQDSRCPVNARCAWSGVGIVNATIISASGERKPIKLSTVNYEAFNNVEKVFGKDITLVDLLPKPVAGSSAKPEITQKLIKLMID